MTGWRSVSIAVLLLLSCAMLAMFFSQPSAGQPPARPPAAAARYQMAVEKNSVYLCDTYTGQVWCRPSPLQTPGKWIKIESPAMKEKNKEK